MNSIHHEKSTLKQDGIDSIPFSNKSQSTTSSKTNSNLRFLFGFLSFVTIFYLVFNPISFKCPHSKHLSSNLNLDSSSNSICPQVSDFHFSPASELPDLVQPLPLDLANLLSGAIQVDTSVEDDFPLVQEDPQIWDKVFTPFSDYLKKSFPKVHSDPRIDLTKVLNHGLLYTWKGSNPDLKPILFMAHQDVVPIEPSTRDSWTHPPFSGFVDEENQVVWGRGASDTKMTLISILASLESLLSTSFQPNRTIIASFGFDEESKGLAAEALSQHLQSQYGPDSISMIIDEGETITSRDTPISEGGIGLSFASPAIAEKGYEDIKMSVLTPGGHSSQPPKHTGIGYLSLLVAELERNPHEYDIGLDNPYLGFLQCVRDAPTLKKELKKSLIKLEKLQLKLKNQKGKLNKKDQKKLDKLKVELLDNLEEDEKLAFVTSQAVDLISGGVKINALPELSTATINHRISITSSVSKLRSRISSVLLPLTKELNLSLNAFNDSSLSNSVEGKANGLVVLEDAWGSALEPAPFTPLADDDGAIAKPFELLSGVIRKNWKEVDDKSGELKSILVAPTLMEGNTDTKSYWPLSRHIFRFSPSTLRRNPIEGGSNIHTVNENEQIDSLVMAWRFFTDIIRGADVVDL